MTTSQKQSPTRRSFLRGGIAAAGAVTLAPALLSSLASAQPAGIPNSFSEAPPPAGDIAILKFLASVELVESDLWTQYSELASNNPKFNQALKNIDPSLIRYNADIRRDETSHANYINATLTLLGEQPVNLDPFRIIKMPNVQGADNIGHLANLTDLTVDTSWYTKLRSTANPDFGDVPPQLVNIVNRPAIPTSDYLSDVEFQAIANTATFHSPSIDEGGTSLYAYLLTKVTDVRVVALLASILPVEAIHFTGFNKSLETLPGVSVNGLTFPDLRSDRAYSEGIFPTPCPFFSKYLPDISVVRPISQANAGAVHLVTKLTASGLFKGQSNAFLDSAMMLATAADAVQRG